MQALNDLTPNDLFRFVNVRGPSPQQEKPAQTAFVPLIYDTPAGGTKRSGGLYPALAEARNKSEPLKASIKLVRDYQGSEAFIADVDAYATTYPQLTDFIRWLDAHAETAPAGTVGKRLASAFGQDARKVVDDPAHREAQCRIWDNLFANLFIASDPALVTTACKYLGSLNLIDLMAHGAAPEKTPGLVYRSRPLVPKWIVALAASLDRKPDEGVEDQTAPALDDLPGLKSRYLDLAAALSDLDGLMERRRNVLRERQDALNRQTKAPETLHQASDETPPRSEAPAAPPRTPAPDPLQIEAGDLKDLAKATVAQLREHLGPAAPYDLDQARGLIGREAARLGSTLGERSRKTAFKVGGAVVETGDFCADMTPRDPCARSPRAEFASRGSFVTSSLIGDLLVTRQQLVKYDLGEVAHVENAMLGLKKLRTHRRLHRSEETELFETTSATEEERETQTTDRFDMEKESSKALEQNFQLDAGVNVSGSYGTMNFSSSLDTSYGGSSSQAQSEATAFSRNVTTRALSRVKETVRRSKTVTLFNEMEETSVNDLVNTTDDHINGVYRWLDKFYLNKIINYGKRLMFEFAVPEPGQFYVFRQLTKPLPDNAIVKPADPKAAHDPSGVALSTPADLTETNYGYWASMYGAAGVEAPPPAYVRISEAWKNTYATSQSGDLYDAFNASMKVPDAYEATFAEVVTDNYWWGSGDIHGVIGAATFGHGYSTLSFPNIRDALGIALLSKGMNWKLNVVLTCQRSAQLYSQWQTKTYGAIMDAYAARLREYQAWLQDQRAVAGDRLSLQGQNPGVNRLSEREELKKRCLELFTGQRFESFDAAVDGVFNVSGYPEILFAEAVREGQIVKFFEQAFDWANMTYIFYPYFWGRKTNWLSTTRLEDPGDPLFTKFLQAGYARVVVPVRPEFENYLMLFHMLTNLVSSMGCSWNFQPSIFGAMGISNTFSPAIDDPTYISVAQELQSAAGYSEEEGPIYGTPYVQKVPTNLVYIAQNAHVAGDPWPGLPDNSADPDIAPYL